MFVKSEPKVTASEIYFTRRFQILITFWLIPCQTVPTLNWIVLHDTHWLVNIVKSIL